MFIEKFVKRGFIIIYGSDRSINIAKSKINTYVISNLVFIYSKINIFTFQPPVHPGNGRSQCLPREHEKSAQWSGEGDGQNLWPRLQEPPRHGGGSLRQIPGQYEEAGGDSLPVRIQRGNDKEGMVELNVDIWSLTLSPVVQVQTAVADLASGMRISRPGEEEEEETVCPVCFSAPEGEEAVRLNHCGHLYCQDCLQLAIGSSAWPLACSAQDCGLLLVVEDFKYLPAELQQRLQKNALDHKLSSHTSDLAACPSPNCSGVYRKVRPDQGGEETQTCFCNYCGVNICRRSVEGVKEREGGRCYHSMFRCDCVYHTGMTCQFYQIYKTDNDHSLRVSRVQSVLWDWKYFQYSPTTGLARGGSFKQETLP